MRTEKPYAHVLPLCLSALLLLLAGNAALGRPAAPPPPPPFAEPVELAISPDAIVWTEEPGTDNLVTREPVRISVGSILPHWVLTYSASEFQGPEGATLDPSRFSTIVSRGAEAPSQAQAEAPSPLGGVVVLAEGGPTGPQMVEVAEVQMRVLIDTDLLAGRYEGTVLIAAHDGNAKKPLRVWQVACVFDVPSIVRVEVDPEPMDFGSQQTGNHLSLTTPWVEIRTNRHDLRIGAEMEALVNASDANHAEIAGSETALAWGHNPNQALKNVRSTPIGGNAFTWDCPPGRHKIYLAGQVRLTAAVPPGKYQGQILITLGTQ